MNKIKDRDYQVAFHDAVFNQWGLIPCNLEEKHAALIESLGHSPFPKSEGVTKKTLGNLATSGGKTVCAARIIETMGKLGKRGIFMADSDELCQQPLDKFYRTIGVMAGLEKASSKTPRSSQIVVASAQTLARQRRLEEFIARWGNPDFIIVDECFPAGTLVDGRPIENIKAGDFVRSWNEKSQRAEMRRVLNVWASRPTQMISIRIGGSEIHCTPGHPFFTQRGWVPALLLTNMDSVLSIEGYEENPARLSAMQKMRGAHVSLKGFSFKTHKVRRNANMRRVHQSKIALRILFQRDSQPLLQNQMESQKRGEISVLNRVSKRTVVTTKKDLQPHARPRGRTGEMLDNPTGDEMGSCDSGWKRERADASAETDRVCIGMGNGGCHPYQNAKIIRVPYVLQSGRRKSNAKNWSGGRRELPRINQATASGQEKRCVPQWIRVDNIKVHQRAGERGFASVCPDGLVYNLHVEGTATYTVGDGLVVHNCHRGSPRNDKIISSLGSDCYVLGITATDFRAGLKDLNKYFTSVCFRLNVLDLIEQGYIPTIVVQNLPIQIDLSKVKTTKGVEGKDYDLDELDDIISPYYAELIEAWKTHANGRQTIAFHPLIRSSQKWVAMCVEAGIKAEHIDGTSEDRKEKLARYEAQEFPMLSCSSLLTTGWDSPPCAVLLPLRPTQSRALYQQMVGRTARVLPGLVEHLLTKEERMEAIRNSAKPNCLILDPMWMTEEMGLVGPGNLIADNADDAEAIKKALKEKKSPEEIAEIAAEIQRQREEKLRAELEARAMRKASLKDAREIGMILHNKELMQFEPMQAWEEGKVSEAQSAYLEKIGIDPDSISCRGHAAAVLDAVVGRQRAGLAPMEAIEPLRKEGHPSPEKATLEEAIKTLKFEFPMTFGKKYYGLPMSTVPMGFWNWLHERWLTGEMTDQERQHPAAFRYMQYRVKEAKTAKK